MRDKKGCKFKQKEQIDERKLDVLALNDYETNLKDRKELGQKDSKGITGIYNGWCERKSVGVAILKSERMWCKTTWCNEFENCVDKSDNKKPETKT